MTAAAFELPLHVLSRPLCLPPALGFFNRAGRRICFQCYLRHSLSEAYWRVAATPVVADLMVSTIWTGCDPDALRIGRWPHPFVSAVYRDGGELVQARRSLTDDEAARTHGHLVATYGGPR